MVPSGLNETLKTLSVCPLRVLIWSPVLAFHKRMVPSALPLAIVVPSGLNDTLETHIRMSSEGADMVACVGVPQTDGFVPTPTCYSGAIRTKRYTQDIIRMSSED